MTRCCAGIVTFAWLVLGGCYRPAPVEGAPCSGAGTCPEPLQCFGGQCLASAPPQDAPEPPPADAPATSDVPMASCAGLQCDDFESGDLTAWGIQRSESGLTVEVSTLQAHSGTRSVRMVVPALSHSGASAYLFRASAAPQSTGVMAARAYIFAPGAITDFSGVMQFRSADPYSILTGDNSRHWTVTELTTTSMLVDHHSTTLTEAGRWTCVELDYAFAPPHVEVYVDDVRVLDAAMVDPAPAYSEIGIGVTRAPLAGFEVFVDDVVVANAHVGCN